MPDRDRTSQAPSALIVAPARSAARVRAVERGSRTEYLAFRLNGETFAAPVTMIHEILKSPPVTPVPRAPREVLGIVSVRGAVVTVYDLRRLLRLASPPLGPRSRVLLVHVHDEVLGLVVDDVLEVHRLADDDIESATAVLGGDVHDHVTGIARPGGEVVILLDLRRLIA